MSNALKVSLYVGSSFASQYRSAVNWSSNKRRSYLVPGRTRLITFTRAFGIMLVARCLTSRARSCRASSASVSARSSTTPARSRVLELPPGHVQVAELPDQAFPLDSKRVLLRQAGIRNVGKHQLHLGPIYCRSPDTNIV